MTRAMVSGLLTIIILLPATELFGQPSIPKEDIPGGMPADVRKDIEGLYSKDAVERGNAAVRLGAKGKRAGSATPFLKALLHDAARLRWAAPNVVIGGDPTSVGIEAAKALARISDSGVEVLFPELKHHDDTVRRVVAEALGRIQDKRAVARLIVLLRDEDMNVRIRTAEALGRIADARAVHALMSRLEDQDEHPYVQRAAAGALGLMVDRSAVPVLIRALTRADVKYIPSPTDAHPHLSRNRVRKSAAEALGRIKDKRAVEPLIAVLKEQPQGFGEEAVATGEVRRAAAKALGDLGDNRAVEPLIEVVQKEESFSFLRDDAIDALGGIKNKRSVEFLVGIVLSDENDDNRGHAVGALKRNTAQDFGGDREKWRRWWKMEGSKQEPPATDEERKAGSKTVEQRKEEAAGLMRASADQAQKAGSRLAELVLDEDAGVRNQAVYSVVRLGQRLGPKLYTAELEHGLLQVISRERQAKQDYRPMITWDSKAKEGRDRRHVLFMGPCLYSAIQALGEIGARTPESLDLLKQLLESDDKNVRWASAYAIVSIDHPAEKKVQVLNASSDREADKQVKTWIEEGIGVVEKQIRETGRPQQPD